MRLEGSTTGEPIGTHLILNYTKWCFTNSPQLFLITKSGQNWTNSHLEELQSSLFKIFPSSEEGLGRATSFGILPKNMKIRSVFSVAELENV